MEKKQGSNKLVVIVLVVVFGGMVLVSCSGILAAIAIPAFLRYIKMSKVSEAQAVTRQMAQTVAIGYTETCSFPEPLAPTFDPAECCGGQKCAPTGQLTDYWAANTTQLLNPNYFAYAATPDGDRFIITAKSDLVCGGPQHTVTLEVTTTRDGETCTATAGQPVTTHELQ